MKGKTICEQRDYGSKKNCKISYIQRKEKDEI